MAIKSATTTLATIQMRRGAEENFDPDQMTAGEWAVSTDSKKVWMCFTPGLVLRMATYEAFEEDMKIIQKILEDCQDIKLAVEAFVELAEQHASQAESWSKISKSWAIGGTGTREGEDSDNAKYYSEQAYKNSKSWAVGGTGTRIGEDTDNAKYYSEQAKASADKAESLTDIGIMTTEKAGIGKPDGTTITVDPDGTMHSAGGGGESGDFVKKSGDTMTGELHLEKNFLNSGGGFFVKDTVKGTQVWLGVGSGQVNHGVFSKTLNKWIVYADDSKVFLNGNANTANKATNDSNGKKISETYAKRSIYGDTSVSLGRKDGSTVGENSIAYGTGATASGIRAVSLGVNNVSSGANSFSSGAYNESVGNNSASFGNNNVSVDSYSFSEGCGNAALGYGSHVEGAQNISGAKYVLKIASYDASAKKFVFDDTYTGFSESFAQLSAGVRLHIANVKYINDASVYTVASVGSDGKSVVVNENIPTSNFSVYLATIIKSGVNYGGCHSEGIRNISLNDNSHSEGYMTEARGYCSHTEGNNAKSSGNSSHAEGFKTEANKQASHAEGTSTKANGICSHSEGMTTIASGDYSHSEGEQTIASGECSHAEGFSCKASGDYSHAEGSGTSAEWPYSHSEGYKTKALRNQHSQGHYNDTNVATGTTSMSGTSSGTAFVIGNGSSTTPSNAARIDYNGKLWCKQAYSSTGADYAELFEWADGNPDNEDRRGYFVTVEGKNIKKAQAGDYILGIISGNPSVIGNTDMEWYGQFMRDEFGTFIKENYKETIKELVIDEEGNVTEEEKEVDVEFYKVNPDYDPDASYTFRLDRPEWDAVGMVGVLPVRDDGTCKVGKFCKCADGGIATLATERGFDAYMVIERVTENIVSVILK